MTNLSETQPAGAALNTRRLTGYHVAAMFLSFFGVIIAVNFTMAWLALNSWTGLIVKNSYVASQHYNEKIEAARNQKEMGWNTNFAYSGNLLSVSVRDKNNQPLFFEKLTVVIGMPVSEYKDMSIILDRNNSGVYSAKIEMSEGAWAYKLVANGEKPYHFEGRFFVNSKGVGILQ